MSNESRRKLLKSIAAGTGVVVAGKSLPDMWSRPVVESVLLPAHAQTSQISLISGVLTTTTFVLSDLGRSNRSFASNNTDKTSNPFNFLIKEAHADDQTAEHLCDGNLATGDITIMFDVPAGPLPKTVDVCIETNSSNSGLCRQAQQTTMATDSTLGDLLDLDIPRNSHDHEISLTGMSVALNGDITGTVLVTDEPNNAANETCTGPFTAVSTASAFTCNVDCGL